MGCQMCCFTVRNSLMSLHFLAMHCRYSQIGKLWNSNRFSTFIRLVVTTQRKMAAVWCMNHDIHKACYLNIHWSPQIYVEWWGDGTLPQMNTWYKQKMLIHHVLRHSFLQPWLILHFDECTYKHTMTNVILKSSTSYHQACRVKQSMKYCSPTWSPTSVVSFLQKQNSASVLILTSSASKIPTFHKKLFWASLLFTSTQSQEPSYWRISPNRIPKPDTPTACLHVLARNENTEKKWAERFSVTPEYILTGHQAAPLNRH